MIVLLPRTAGAGPPRHPCPEMDRGAHAGRSARRLHPNARGRGWHTTCSATAHWTDLAGASTTEGQLFGVLGRYPTATAMTVLVMVLVAIFFVSGADAASIVLGSRSERDPVAPGKPIVVLVEGITRHREDFVIAVQPAPGTGTTHESGSGRVAPPATRRV